MCTRLPGCVRATLCRGVCANPVDRVLCGCLNLLLERVQRECRACFLRVFFACLHQESEKRRVATITCVWLRASGPHHGTGTIRRRPIPAAVDQRNVSRSPFVSCDLSLWLCFRRAERKLKCENESVGGPSGLGRPAARSRNWAGPRPAPGNRARRGPVFRVGWDDFKRKCAARSGRS